MSSFTQWIRSLNGATFPIVGAPSFLNAGAPVKTPSFVQAINTDAQALATTSVAVMGSQGAGNVNLVSIGWGTAAITIVSVLDTAGNTYNLIGKITSGAVNLALYAAQNIIAGANTVTVTFSSTGSINRSLNVIEYSGVDSSGFGGSSFAALNSTSLNVGPLTPLSGGLLVTGVFNSGSGNIITIPPGFTSRVNTSVNLDDAIADQPATPAVIANPTWGLTSAGIFVGWALVLRGSVIAGLPSPSGSGVIPVVYQDKACQWSAIINSVTGTKVNVEVLAPGDNPPVNWVILQQFTTSATGPNAVQFFGPWLAVRLNLITLPSGSCNGDLMWTEFEWY